ncbi:hypothetical protein AVEN_158619-1 [Araneus ventricosus]|uniref:Uncharacterized protein n=1 Tax=Araneus ventricosus TaxID=182803 RepID=A0A4Y2I6X1_ARAVE|nr:hypothetical protein AVEN_158619-1 [Araneus ventricosus]
MFSAFLLLLQKIVAFLLPSPPLTNSPPQLLAMKHNGTPLALGFALPQAHRNHCYPPRFPSSWSKTHPISARYSRICIGYLYDGGI